MSELLLPLNGIGQGHLTRALIFSEWLRCAGRRPMIVLQGNSEIRGDLSVPVSNIPPLYSLAPPAAQRIANDLCNCARLSAPTVIIEDTHPAPVKWPRDVQRLLVVRPTNIEYMRLINYRQARSTAGILVCDHPDSPTWPFDEAATREVVSWPGWICIRPVFRRASMEGMRRVGERHRVDPDDQVFVFSMGGGGERIGSGDRDRFVRIAAEIAAEIDRRVARRRLFFVRGPLFPIDLPLPPIFEPVTQEPDLPSLFQLARGAVVRPGYNVTWECIAGGTPFIAIPGTTFNEPIDARLCSMAAKGLDTSQDVDRLLDADAARRFADACAATLHAFDGVPRDAFLAATEGCPGPKQRLTVPPVMRVDASSATWQIELARAVHEAPGPVPIRIRIDDVTCLDPMLDEILGICRELGAFVSLEIVPYHCALTSTALDRLDKDGHIEVAQHGYAHLPVYDQTLAWRGEFSRHRADGPIAEQLRLGFRRLASEFGRRFNGGYSAPYDALQKWLPGTWQKVGGRYISWIRNRPSDAVLPAVRVSVDPWDWTTRSSHPLELVASKLAMAIRREHEAGLVLHPQCLADDGHRRGVTQVLETLVGAGCVPTRINPCGRLEKYYRNE